MNSDSWRKHKYYAQIHFSLVLVRFLITQDLMCLSVCLSDWFAFAAIGGVRELILSNFKVPPFCLSSIIWPFIIKLFVVHITIQHVGKMTSVLFHEAYRTWFLFLAVRAYLVVLTFLKRLCQVHTRIKSWMQLYPLNPHTPRDHKILLRDHSRLVILNLH